MQCTGFWSHWSDLHHCSSPPPREKKLLFYWARLTVFVSNIRQIYAWSFCELNLHLWCVIHMLLLIRLWTRIGTVRLKSIRCAHLASLCIVSSLHKKPQNGMKLDFREILFWPLFPSNAENIQKLPRKTKKHIQMSPNCLDGISAYDSNDGHWDERATCLVNKTVKQVQLFKCMQYH